MTQIGKHTGTNDKNRKDQYTKIKRVNIIQKSSSLSPLNNNSEGNSSSMKHNKLYKTKHDLHNCTYENNKINTTMTQHQKINRAQYTPKKIIRLKLV